VNDVVREARMIGMRLKASFENSERFASIADWICRSDAGVERETIERLGLDVIRVRID
jgi:hypothetical protein